LRCIHTVQDWNEKFPTQGVGCFKVKILGDDYLCSEMAKRYINFLNSYPDLFEMFPSDYIMEILAQAANEEHQATACAVKCPYCASVIQSKSEDQPRVQWTLW
jgi:hypothetical protein